MKHFWLNIKDITSFMLFFYMAAFASAQSLSVQTDVIGNASMPAVKVDNVWHATNGANVKFVMTFVSPELEENQRNLQIQSVTCQFNGEMKTGALTNSNTFEFEGVASMKDSQVATFSLSYSYEQLNEDNKYEVITPDPMVINSEEIRIWDTPSCSVEVLGSNYSTSDRTLKAITMGGSEQWAYLWNGIQGDESYIEMKPSLLPARVGTDIEIKNYAPDGKTEWLVYKSSISTYFYDIPTVTTKSIADDLVFYKQLPESYWSVDVVGGGSTTEYLWYLNDTELKSENNQFNPETKATDAIVKGNVKLVVVTYADDGTELWRSDKLFNEEYTIYPQATLSADKLTKSIYLGETAIFSPSYNGGGFPSGNVYVWSGDIESASKDLTVSPTSAGTYTYVLKSQNKYGDNVWEVYDDQIYTLNVYQQPSCVITETIDYDSEFEGATVVPQTQKEVVLRYGDPAPNSSTLSMLKNDIVRFVLTNNGGAAEWSYRVTDNGTSLEAPYQLSQEIGSHQLVISVVNGENEMETPYREEYRCTYIYSSLPSAERASGCNETYETCGGNQIPLSISVSGNQEGWKVQWKKDGKNLEGQTSYTYIDNVVYNDLSGDGDKRTSIVGANVTFLSGDKVRFDKTINFEINYWPEPRNISDFAIKDLYNENNKFTNDKSIDGATRRGNALMFMAERAAGGYGNPSVWKYEWTKNSSVLNTYTTVDGWESSFMENVDVVMGNTKDYEDIVYSLRTSNYQNGLWAAENIVSKTIRVYNRPATPTSLTKKGTGASGTMIAITNGLTDKDLEDRQYYLVFGYEDSHGNEIRSFEKQQTNLGNTRFEAQFSSSEVNNSNYRFFVYAKWKYDNNVEITSGKRYINGVDEIWDGSDYSGLTRSVVDGDASSIMDVSDSIERSYTRIYTLGGQMVRSSEHLPSGIYIIETLCNGKKSTQKVVVK